MKRHRQVDVGRFAFWAGIDTSTIALQCFVGYTKESVRFGLSVGPVYIGGGFA